METGPQLKVPSDRLVKPGIEPATSGLQDKVIYPLHHGGTRKLVISFYTPVLTYVPTTFVFVEK